MQQVCCVKTEDVKTLCTCSYEEALSLIGKKWAVLILRIIKSTGASGYNEIFTQISGITPKAFGDKLKTLEDSGLIRKRIVSDRPFRTEYSLTSKGEKLLVGLEPFFS